MDWSLAIFLAIFLAILGVRIPWFKCMLLPLYVLSRATAKARPSSMPASPVRAVRQSPWVALLLPSLFLLDANIEPHVCRLGYASGCQRLIMQAEFALHCCSAFVHSFISPLGPSSPNLTYMLISSYSFSFSKRIGVLARLHFRVVTVCMERKKKEVKGEKQEKKEKKRKKNSPPSDRYHVN